MAYDCLLQVIKIKTRIKYYLKKGLKFDNRTSGVRPYKKRRGVSF